MKRIYFLLFLFLNSLCFSAQTVENKLPQWQTGYLDIHHINIGCGECAYCILPDGTTMMIDAGDNSPSSERHVAPRPNNTGYILDDSNANYTVKAVYGVYFCD